MAADTRSYPHPRPKVRPLSDRERAQIFQSLGAASTCWNPQPTGTFDSKKAREVGEALVAFLESPPPDRSYLKHDPHAVPEPDAQRCPECGFYDGRNHAHARSGPGLVDVGWKCPSCGHEWGFEVLTGGD